uniref:FZ domain-containing protein n=1 Tax=Hofstenia miamia TaxID=442651 RepID=A0A5P8I4P7_HOFMI|nr:hypothetical protein [Hofstenia miamia]
MNMIWKFGILILMKLLQVHLKDQASFSYNSCLSKKLIQPKAQKLCEPFFKDYNYGVFLINRYDVDVRSVELSVDLQLAFHSINLMNVKSECKRNAKKYMCILLYPACTQVDKFNFLRIAPCAETCDKIKRCLIKATMFANLERTYQSFKGLNCSLLPSSLDSELCYLF